MWRNLHAFFGLSAAVLLVLLSISGTILATSPIYDALQPQAQSLSENSIADAIEIATRNNKKLEIERLKISASGAVIITGRNFNRPIKAHLNLQTGQLTPIEKPNAFYRFIKEFHRSLFLGFTGRVIVIAASAIMCVLCFSGLIILVRRMGGWRHLLNPVKGRWPEKWHVWASRLCLLPLIITSVSALYLGMITLGALPSGQDTPPAYPESLEELNPVPAHTLKGLKNIALRDVKEVIFPIPEDWFDVFAVKTHREHLFFDQFTGALLSQPPLSIFEMALNLFVLLHTGEGLAPWGIIAGIATLSIPIFAFTGLVIWLNRIRSGMGRIKNNAAAQNADLIILVGSENGSTWGFAKALHQSLTQLGKNVHIRALNDMRASYPRAEKLIVLTATYGDGEAPQNAKRFNKRLKELQKNHLPQYCVLGFGDKSFPQYCAFATQIDNLLQASGRKAFMPIADIDRKSSQSFEHWGAKLAKALGLPLSLRYEPPKPRTYQLVLDEKRLYGEALQAPTAVLRFIGSKNDIIPAHQPGDLAAIYPGTQKAPRLYSIGSSVRESCLEICVSRQEGGICSPYLCGLRMGDQIELHIERNPQFNMPRQPKKPVIMIGAGTGIAPFAGMIRNNFKKVPIDLFWGNRDPEHDHFYADHISNWISEQKLENFYPAFSRINGGLYVQERICEHADKVINRVQSGATIMICGGAYMAQGVRHELEKIAVKAGCSIAELKRSGRYLEDTY